MIKNEKNQIKGITLIALVITIIVLLILAGISISMLAGDNSLLQKAVDAKIETEKGKEKEIISLAYSSAVTKKVSSGDSSAIKGSELNRELNNSEAIAKKDSPILVTFISSKRQYKVYSNGIIEYAGTKDDNDDDSVKLSFNPIQTESRAIILQVSVNGVESVENWLKSLSEDELKEVFLKSWYGEDAQWSEVTYWNEATQSEEVYTDVRDYYSKNYSDICTDEYEMMLTQREDWETGKPATVAYYDRVYGPEIELGEEKIKGTVAEFIITNPGNYNISATTKDGEYIEDTWNAYPETKIETYSTTKVTAETGKNSKTVTSIDNKTVEVPAGFYYGTSDNVGKVSTGFVITDSVDENTGYSNGNEFVWIPVNYNSSTGDITVAGTTKKMAEISSGTDYRGVLYNWNLDATGNTTIPYDSTEYREPQDRLQSDYNSMIESVKKYGGFYVARYEMGANNNIMISKLGVETYKANTWYELKTMASTYSTDSVQSSMICGSQWDAILNYALASGDDSGKVNSVDYGNSGYDYLRTGLTLTSDKINNIFDLSGNYSEFTSEEKPKPNSWYEQQYTLRGNNCNPCGRLPSGENIMTIGKCTRASIYIKP